MMRSDESPAEFTGRRFSGHRCDLVAPVGASRWLHSAYVAARALEWASFSRSTAARFPERMPGGIGGHGDPSSRTHACSGPARAGAALVNAMPGAIAVAPNRGWLISSFNPSSSQTAP